ncbi:hypothetical protein P280DRAFT_390834 [Massarina eburnea CBS 473.64]|uniref:Protein sip5 n=1 Tax=Massarina eburnea CBS 473.64 TaxID=1395130 RepID=A0A6A6SBD9_9PLEO|nr:hypothetical protein P280DRAFT_390834 [Massarina eburnea CBS 473.64]
MGNSQAKESRPISSRGHGRPGTSRNPSSPTASGHDESSSSRHGRPVSGVYSSRNGRGSRPDLSFLGLGGSSERDPALEPRRETKAEREARKLEKERQLRAQERERSLREEGIDGGFLVTLGTYTGPEDFSKPSVRQLQIERRLAPFWKGLDDHEDTWTEHQIASVVQGKPLPAPDEIPPEEPSRPNNLSAEWNARRSNSNINSLTVPIGARSMSQTSDHSSTLSPSHPAFSLPSPTSPIASVPASSTFFRGRAKTLASLTSGSRNNSQADMTPQEILLPQDPYVNGQRVEVFLYKNASECPICFLYYPPYLNKTRCCEQPICSECFVQIKRPDPHPPEHHEGPDAPPQTEPQEDGQLVSEPACCPFCVQPEFGVTYEPPPFRRGLAYANHLASAASAMSSTSSVSSQGLASPPRRRGASVAANDTSVITTDRVRPDWAKKLADARAHQMRRSAAATALHNAAYMMGNIQGESRGFGLGRRRRNMFGNESASSSGQGTPRRGDDLNALIQAAAAQGSSSRNEGQGDLIAGRQSSRRGNRIEDLEELMMMEAIRLSLAAEEERKKKEEKEAAKEAKKEEKKKAKEAKKADKAARKSGFFPLTIQDGADENVIERPSSATGKGKAVDRSGGFAGFNPLNEPSSTVEPSSSSSREDPQKFLEESRAQIQREVSNNGSAGPFDPSVEQTSHRAALRDPSNASSSISSLEDSLPSHDSQDSSDHSPNASGVDLSADDTPPNDTPGTESMFNFKSLAEGITPEDGKDESKAQHIEDVTEGTSSAPSTPEITIQNTSAPQLPGLEPMTPLEESVATIKPSTSIDDDEIEPEAAPAPPVVAVTDHSNHFEAKRIGEMSIVEPITQHLQ